MAKQSTAAKEKSSNTAMEAIYDPCTYDGFAVTGDWRQGFSVILNGVPLKFTRSLGVDTQIDFEVWAEVTDGPTTTNVLLVATSYGEEASKLMQEFSRRAFDAITGQNDEKRAKAMAAVTWAAEGNRKDRP